MVNFATRFMPELLVKNFIAKIYETETTDLKEKIYYMSLKDSENYKCYSDTDATDENYKACVVTELDKLKIEMVENVDSIALLSLLSDYDIGDTYGFIVVNRNNKKMYNPMNIFSIDEFLEDYLNDYKETSYNLIKFSYNNDTAKDLLTKVLERNFATLFNLYTEISNNKKFITVGVKNELKKCPSLVDAIHKVVNDFKKDVASNSNLNICDIFNDYHNTSEYMNDKNYLASTLGNCDLETKKGIRDRKIEFIIPVSLATRFITYPYYGLAAVTGELNNMIGRNLSFNFLTGNLAGYNEVRTEERYYLHVDGNDEEIDEYDYNHLPAIEIAVNLGYDIDFLYDEYYYFDHNTIDYNVYEKIASIAYNNQNSSAVLTDDDYETYVDIYDVYLKDAGVDEDTVTRETTYKELYDMLSEDRELSDNADSYVYTYSDEYREEDDEAVSENGLLYTDRVCLGDNRKDIPSLPALKNMNIESMYYQNTLGDYYKEEAFNHQTIAQAIIKKFIIDNKL